MDYRSSVIRRIRSDGVDFAIETWSGDAIDQELQRVFSSWHGRKLTWGQRHAFGRHGLGPYWRIYGEALSRSMPALHAGLMRAARRLGRSTALSLAALEDWVAHAKARPERGLLTEGIQITLRRLESHGTAVSSTYHGGLLAAAMSQQGAILHRQHNLVEIPYSYAEDLIELLTKNLCFDRSQISIPDKIFRITDDAIVELSDSERIDWEKNLGSTIDIDAPFSATSKSDAEREAREKVWLEVTSRIKEINVDRESRDLHLAECEKNLAKSFPTFKKYLDAQVVGIDFLLGKSSGLLADDMGLGKTVTATISAGYRQSCDGGQIAIVSTRSSLRGTWLKTIKGAYPRAKVALKRYEADANWVVVNYESAGVLLKHADKFSVVIFDEAHKVCSPTAQRTTRAFELAERIPNRYLLSGTPILNSSGDLHTLLRLSGHPAGAIELSKFLSLMEDDGFRSNLHGLLRKSWLLRRLKTSVMDMPEKRRHLVDIAISAEQRMMLDSTMYAKQKGGFIALAHKVRAQLASFKTPVLIDKIDEFASQNRKLIIFCEYRSHIDAISAILQERGLGHAVIHGQTSDSKRIIAENEFQTNPDCKFFIGTLRAAGESITLTAATGVFVLTLPWTWAALDQGEARPWRNGQNHPVDVFIPLVEDSIDKYCWELISRKLELQEDLFLAQEEDENSNISEIMAAARQAA